MQITVGIITVSDRATSGEYKDLGGPALKTAAESGWMVRALRSGRSRRYRTNSGNVAFVRRIKVAALFLRPAEQVSPSAMLRPKQSAPSCVSSFRVLVKRCGASREKSRRTEFYHEASLRSSIVRLLSLFPVNQVGRSNVWVLFRVQFPTPLRSRNAFRHRADSWCRAVGAEIMGRDSARSSTRI